jgi:hypothetical protein
MSPNVYYWDNHIKVDERARHMSRTFKISSAWVYNILSINTEMKRPLRAYWREWKYMDRS